MCVIFVPLTHFSRLVTVLSNDLHNGSRVDFLAELKKWADSRQTPRLAAKLVKSIKAWVTKQEKLVLDTLKVPELSECNALIDLVCAHGGLKTLRDRCVNNPPRPVLLN